MLVGVTLPVTDNLGITIQANDNEELAIRTRVRF
jgi:hypothetical protein